jgi:hypothetical protein
MEPLSKRGGHFCCGWFSITQPRHGSSTAGMLGSAARAMGVAMPPTSIAIVNVRIVHLRRSFMRETPAKSARFFHFRFDVESADWARYHPALAGEDA